MEDFRINHMVRTVAIRELPQRKVELNRTFQFERESIHVKVKRIAIEAGEFGSSSRKDSFYSRVDLENKGRSL